MFTQSTKFLGVGINYRSEISDHIIEHIHDIDFIEVFTEKFFIKNDDPKLFKIMDNLPTVLHGLDLSIGSCGEIESNYKVNLIETLKTIHFEWFSDHISLTRENGIEVGHLMPVQFSEKQVDQIVKKAKEISSLSDKPFLLENITYYYPIPGSNLEEHQFLTKILNDADCGMLLDLNNLYINAVNHNYDPYAFLKKLPLDRVIEIHLAGGSYKFDMLVDTHANSIKKEVWDLFRYTTKITPVKGVIIERDSNLNDFTDIIKEVHQARDILKSNKVVKK